MKAPIMLAETAIQLTRLAPPDDTAGGTVPAVATCDMTEALRAVTA